MSACQTASKIADRLAVLDDVGDDVEFRMLLVEWFSVGIGPRGVEVAKIFAERDELRVGQRLSMEHHHQPFAPDIFDGADISARHRLRQIDAADFRAQRGIQVLDRYRHR
jgi:hypothetical protein